MFKLIFRYFIYKITAKHRRGYGIHYDIVYRIIRTIHENKKKTDPVIKHILKWRRELSEDNRMINTDHFGAGSLHAKNEKRSISSIVRHSSISHKYGKVLFSLSRYFQPKTIIELGTGVGISTAYLANGNPEASLLTIEGASEKSLFAARELTGLGIQNVTFLVNEFESFIDSFSVNNYPLMVFFDGNHTYSATMNYFKRMLKFTNHESIFIFDDINWSSGMQKAWKEIVKSEETIISIDLFFLGIILFNENTEKKHYIISF